MRHVKRVAMAFALIALAYVAVLAFPQLFFANRFDYKNYEIWSDKPIDPRINKVLDDATRRLRTSELYDPDRKIRVYFCNAPWRLWLYSQHFTDKLGGATDTWLTRNVYIRASDIGSNRIDSPGPGPILDPDQRPLSYYIAHEATHVIESREFGRLMVLRYPQWLTEGYADYVGKGGDFDFDENLRLLLADSFLLDYERSGLYRRYELEVLYLINRRGLTVRQIFADPPRELDLLKLLRNSSQL